MKKILKHFILQFLTKDRYRAILAMNWASVFAASNLSEISPCLVAFYDKPGANLDPDPDQAKPN